MKGVGNFAGFAKKELSKEDKVLEGVKRLVAEKAAPSAICDAAVQALHGLPRYSWVGIYMVEGEELVLRSWKGPEATQHTRIPLGDGVCGAAARSGKTEVVADVSKDPRYLECFPSTKSKVVVPIKDGTRVYGEIDVDSDTLAAFGEKDRLFLEKLAFQIMLGVRGKV